MPKQFAKHIAALRDCKRVAIWRMHQLYKSHHPWVNALRQQHWGSVIDGNPVTHANWQLLQLFSAYTWSVILMVLYAVLLFVCLGAVIDFPAEDVMVYLAIAVFGSVAWVWLWCLRVYARWRAEPLDHQRPRWFFYLLIINALVYLSVVFDVAEWIGQMAASLWAVGVLLWLGYYMMKPNSTSLLIRLHGLSRHIFAATLMVLSMFTVLWGMAMLGLIWFYQPVDQQVWRNGLSSVLLMLLPMAILFYRDVIWRDLISGWERRSDDPYTTQQKWAIGLSLAATAGLFPLLFAEHVWSVAGWLGLMVTLLTIPSKVMAYLIKYWFYLPMMGLVLSSDGGQWLAIPMMSYTLFEAYRDLKLEREHQAA